MGFGSGLLDPGPYPEPVPGSGFPHRGGSGAANVTALSSHTASSSLAPGGRTHLADARRDKTDSSEYSGMDVKFKFLLAGKGTEAEPDFEDVASGLQLALHEDMHRILPVVGLPLHQNILRKQLGLLFSDMGLHVRNLRITTKLLMHVVAMRRGQLVPKADGDNSPGYEAIVHLTHLPRIILRHQNSKRHKVGGFAVVLLRAGFSFFGF